MLTSRTFLKRTRAGAVMKVVREHYLREDIACGAAACEQCGQQPGEPRLEAQPSGAASSLCPAPHYLLPDTNVLLHQVPTPPFPPGGGAVRVGETYIEQEQGETSNDRNDKAIRVATKWYDEHLKKINSEETIQVILLTNDRNNKEKAVQEGLIAYTCEEYIKSLIANPDLVDRLACVSDEGKEIESGRIIFSEHLPLSKLQQGIKSGIYFQGTFRANRDNYLEATVWVHGDAEENKEIIIQGLKNLNRAVHEDLVAVELLAKDQWVAPSSVVLQDEGQNEDDDENEEEKENTLKSSVSKNMLRPSGRVVGIIKRNWRPFCGMLSKSQIKEARRHLFTPADRRIPRIRIETRQASTLEGQRIIVAIDGWPRNSRYPNNLGFYLRYLCVCSVDPPELENGNLEVGVHIADVSHFIRPGNALDQESAKRGTTVYLCEKRIDMVPELLSSNLCSLRSNVDRYFCMWYCHIVFLFKASLTYAEAQMRIDSANMKDNITTSLRGLNKLAKILKKRRVDNGALTLSSPEVRFHMDSETHDPIDLQTKELKETNSMVEEFMLLANISVAKKIHKEFSEYALLRKHPAPPPSNYDILVKAAKSKNLEIKTDSAKALADTLDKAESPEFPYLNTLLRILATRCMMQAVYFCSGMDNDFHHYGLASPIYTHFTSPIRRYADIIVHRLLAVAINADSTYPELTDKHKLADLCKNLNYRHKMAQYAQRASVAFHTQLFFKNTGVVNEEAYILFVRKNAIVVLIPKYGLEGTVFFEEKDKPKPNLSYNDEVPSLTVENTTFYPFDKVKVNVMLDASNIQHQKIRMALVEPKVRHRLYNAKQHIIQVS
uniref:Exosome complex exonuclease RRP44 n=1 Tax=Gopherus evgoodei TaxID=1825980 RepID=A0A8C4VHD3_9SAUR